MNTQNHSPEPWRYETRFGMVQDAEGRIVLDASAGSVRGYDIRRIVAAVNACAELPIEALDALAVKDVGAFLRLSRPDLYRGRTVLP